MGLIDADVLKKVIERCDYPGECLLSIESILDIIDDAPTVDAVPVVHSRPVQFFDDPYTGRMITTCMMCDGKVSKKDRFCKHCGAKMDLERSNDG